MLTFESYPLVIIVGSVVEIDGDDFFDVVNIVIDNFNTRFFF